ncbi:MAG: class I SAM-dependent methyltransferase [Thermoflexales bacterium]|nr:class I SAM-dependent methyltransferase [Thermoflexales bacterium]MDW8351402.1 class I SAM-dependent methyltransferase [Anaerolineae bacterium]
MTRNAFARPPEHDFLWNQLVELPYFRALLRAVESRFYQELPIVEPVLDLGSGDGSFAAHTFSRPLDVGLDPWAAPLWESRARRAHKLLIQAEGARLPFADCAFRTVVSNSVLEHIPDLEPVLAECFRVLRPGGYLLFCSPSDHFTDWLIGAKVAGDAYRRWFNRISRHYHCDGPSAWRARLERAGFTVERMWYYFSPRALRALEVGHYLGLPNLLWKKITGRWVVFPSARNPVLRLLYRLLRPLYDEPRPEAGAYLFGVARKGE